MNTKDKDARFYANHRMRRLRQMKAWRENHPNYFKAWRVEQIASNRCPRCGAPLMEDEDRYCVACYVGRHIPVRV